MSSHAGGLFVSVLYCQVRGTAGFLSLFTTNETDCPMLPWRCNYSRWVGRGISIGVEKDHSFSHPQQGRVDFKTVHRDGFPDPSLSVDWWWWEYPNSTKTWGVLGNPSPPPSRFPLTLINVQYLFVMQWLAKQQVIGVQRAAFCLTFLVNSGKDCSVSAMFESGAVYMSSHLSAHRGESGLSLVWVWFKSGLSMAWVWFKSG